MTTLLVSALSGRSRRRRRTSLGVLGVISAVVLIVLVIAAVIGPLIAPHDPTAADLSAVNLGPSPDHLLGTDSSGYDLFSALLVGARTSLLGPIAVIAVAVIIAVPLALTAAWFGGIVDSVIARVLDIVFAFPGILLAILAAAVFGDGLLPVAIALAISYTPYLGRVIRSAAIRERSLPYIEALTVQGFGGFSISVRHMLKNLLPTVAAQCTVSFGYAMVDLAALSYLGLGVQRPTPDWGLMVATGQQGILQGYPQESLLAGLLIVIVVAAFNMLGERIADLASGQRS